ncbi:hypothetical protein ARNL5_03855 [Anaerolineae bacterium]|nr:hypothetical protein ARNL5_03855 [Anaerolineae bacterium]
MNRLAAAAIIAAGLLALTPMDSFAWSNNNGHSKKINGNENGGSYCPPNGGNNHAVPEPATMALLGAAFGAIYLSKKKSQKQ